MIKSIYETVTRTKVSIEYIKQKDRAWRNKLVTENVVQSTMHFVKRTSKLMGVINKVSPFIHDGVEYFVDSYFIRTEYQQRGSQHDHVMMWLRSKDGQKPPSMWSDTDEDMMVTGQKIAEFAHSLIQCSTDDAKCSSHKEFDDTCVKCLQISVPQSSSILSQKEKV